nr:hypothetical protein [Tanacetum cinerariifolium]
HGDVCLSWGRWGKLVGGRGSGGYGLESEGRGVVVLGGKNRRRWILSRGLRLVLAKCLASPKYLSALGEAIGRAIEKGMQDGLTSGIEHGRAGRSIADVLAFNPSSEGDCIAAINALRDVNFSLLAQLEANMDSSMADIMDLLRLEGPAVEAFGASQLLATFA